MPSITIFVRKAHSYSINLVSLNRQTELRQIYIRNIGGLYDKIFLSDKLKIDTKLDYIIIKLLSVKKTAAW
jgi:hypothetical protein